MRRFFKAAFVVAAFTMNNDANAQEKISISVKGIPQFSFFQNRDDHDTTALTESQPSMPGSELVLHTILPKN